ncbi:MAG: extracellular solute-binding protein [Ruminococcaceae bacterium]|nr:extracellular solute-binding protein [Oscillospiraceae bacterium]
MKRNCRILALVLALVMTVSLFAACGGSEDPATTTTAATTTAATTTAATTTAATTTEATTTEATTTEATTTEPALDLAGYEFSIANGGEFFPAVDENGNYRTAIEEALADELADLEAELGITIVETSVPGDNLTEALIAAAMGSVKYADIIYQNQREMFPVARVNGLVPMDDEKLVAAGLDATDSTRWYQPVQAWTYLFDHLWGLTVASEYVPAQTGFFVCFNKDLCASVGYDDMYQLVKDGKWNWELYRQIARETTKDTDGDGTNDIWGTGATAWGCEAVCNGVQFIGEVDGKWQMTIDSEAGIEALQFLVDMNYADGTRWDVGSGECRQAFANGTITFNWADMGHINGPGSALFDSNHDYGILPMPTGSRGTIYGSMTDNCDALWMQASNADYEKSVAIMNEWALIVNDEEAYLDILDDGRCRTEADKEMMIEYIMPNYTLNMGKISPEIWDLVDSGIISGVSYYGMTPQQAIEAYRDPLNAALDEFFGQ